MRERERKKSQLISEGGTHMDIKTDRQTDKEKRKRGRRERERDGGTEREREKQ
jgi:hypothetical protein